MGEVSQRAWGGSVQSGRFELPCYAYIPHPNLHQYRYSLRKSSNNKHYSSPKPTSLFAYNQRLSQSISLFSQTLIHFRKFVSAEKQSNRGYLLPMEEFLRG